MKKVVAILLIALFLFNHIGYRFLFTYMQQQADVQMQASLDKDDYVEADLITLTVPLSIPYQNNQEHFERVDGEITLNGKIYKYVKRKVSDGNLILLCVPDHNKMRIESAKDEFFKYANDLVQNNHSKKSDHSKEGVFKNLLSDYDTCCNSFFFFNSLELQNSFSSTHSDFLSSNPHSTPGQPPEIV